MKSGNIIFAKSKGSNYKKYIIIIKNNNNIKQLKTPPLIGVRCPYAVIYCLQKLWIYQVLFFIVSLDTSTIGNKIPNQEFYWSATHLGIWTDNQPGLQTDFSENWCSFAKIGFFKKTSGNPVRKKKVYQMNVVIQNSVMKGKATINFT